VTEKRIRMLVEYDGSGFEGYQLQGPDVRSVQRELEAAFTRLAGHRVRVHGAGRTDKGVHATGQVVHADVCWRFSSEQAEVALNAILPRDVVVRGVTEVDETFHSQRSATSRTYMYLIDNGKFRRPTLGHRAWHVDRLLDIDAMRCAAGCLTGVHDFASFGNAAKGKSTVRRLDAIDVRRKGDLVVIHITANAFLRQMVRAIVGSLVEVGIGRISVSRLETVLALKNKGICPRVAPPHGLTLKHVSYDGVRIDLRNKE
jgi:tRNA pseudouridine38-40 synthase